jgi:hypothetical protein
MTIKYYYLAMTQKSMLRSHILEEILRERAHNYLFRRKSLDFWLLIAPEFLVTKEIKHKIELVNIPDLSFHSALISLDIDFLRWVQLRLGSFLSGEILGCIEVKDSTQMKNIFQNGEHPILEHNINGLNL